MAEPKTQYQFGLKSLDMDSYIRNIGSNVRSYIDYNVKHRGWTEDQVNEFTQSYERYLQAFLDQLKNKTTRFSTNDLGDIIDSQGEFNNIDKNSEGLPEEFYYNGKGERIDQSQYDALKDRKKKKYTTFNANREVAEFFRRVGTKLSEYKAPPKDKFDINKHGFVTWWQKKYNPSSAQVYIQPYLDLDPVGADGKRPVANRATRAAQWMNEYLDYMKDQDLDFSDYPINNLDDYIARGRALAQEWNNGNWTPEDLIKALEFGVLPEFSEGYFSTEEDPSLSPAERLALAERQALLEQLQQLQQQLQLQQQRNDAANLWVQEQIATYNNNLGNDLSAAGAVVPRGSNVGSILLGASDPFKDNHIAADSNVGKIVYADPDITSATSQFQKDLAMIGGLGINIRDNTGIGYDFTKLHPAIENFVRDPYQYSNYINSGAVGSLLRLALAGGDEPYGQIIPDGKYAGCVWFPNINLLKKFNRALVYNPLTKSLEFVFVGHIPQIWNDMKNEYLTSLGIDPNALNAEDFAFEVPQRRLGGKFQQGGVTPEAFASGFNNYVTRSKDAAATRRGVSADQLARLRRPVSRGISFDNAANDNLMEQLGGWTARDYWQLANIGADITSMVSAFVPGYGTIASAATGAGSSVSLFIYDLGDDTTGFLGDLGNLAVGLGMDLVGLIPGFGATSKGAKIAKNLIKYVPRLMAVIGTYQGLGNSPQIMASLRKAKNGEDLTVDDWKNIAQGIGIATGVGGGAVRHVQTRHVNPHLGANSSLMPRGRLRNLIQKPTETGDVAVQLRNKDTNVIETRRFTGDEAAAIRNAKSPADILKIVFRNNPGLGDYELVTNTSLRPHLRFGWPPLYHPEKVRAMAVQRSASGKEYVEGNWHLRDVKPVTETSGEGIYRRAVTENPELIRAAKASKQYESRLQQRSAKIAEAEKNIADIRNKAAEYQRDNGLVGDDLSKSIQDIDKQITTINANRRGNIGQAADAAFRTKQQRVSDLDLLIRNKTSEINTIKASGSDKGLKQAQDELAALQLEYDSTKKWLADNDNSVITGLQLHRKALEDFNVQIGKLTKNKNTWEGYSEQGHTVAFTRLKAKAKDGKISFTDPDNPKNIITRDFDQVMKDLGIRYRVGGKFEIGGGIRDVQGNADWFTHMYSSEPMKTWLSSFTPSNYLQFNSLLDSWENNLTESGYTPGGNAIYNTGVLMRLPVWNNNGTNAVIGDLRNRGILTGNGGTTDTAAGNYTDGYFGAQEYLRHGGTKTSWEGHETELQALQEQFKTQGLEYYLDKDNGMYKLRPLNVAKAAGDADDDNNDQSDVTQAYGDREDLKDKPTIDKNKLTSYVNPKWLAFGQAMYANAVNDRMTDRALESNKAVLYDPKNDTRYMQGDLDALMTGQMAAGQLMHIGSQPITSDGSLYAATMLDAAAKGEEYKIQGRTTNNTALRKRAQEILEQRITDHAFNYDVANKNRLALYLTAANRTTLLNARDSKNYDNQKTLFDEIMYDVKSDWNRRRTIQESLDKADIHSRVMDNLSEYVTLTPEEEAAWNKVRSGEATYTQLQGNEAIAYRSALKKASQAETNQLRILYGLPTVDYASSNTTSGDGITIVNRQGGVLISKDGSKIRIAKIRERSRQKIKDADRLYKTTKDRHDRTDRNIARADKKMYPLNEPISSRRRK